MPLNDPVMAPLRNLDEFILGESRWIFVFAIISLSVGIHFGFIHNVFKAVTE
jgi:hypothetical protein